MIERPKPQLMQHFTTCLWFDGNAEQAVDHYASLFKDLEILSVNRFGKEGPMPEGTVMVVAFRMNGAEFIALNGGPHYQFTPAISLVINCDDQAEIDYFWDGLSAGGQEQQCGWLTDKFGVTWQVVPSNIGTLMSGTPEQSARVTAAFMQMKKLDKALIEAVYYGK